jgi:putative restriction endonuclease
VGAIYEHEIHKLLGVPVAWLNQIADGAALAYLSNRADLLTGTQESPSEAEEETTSPVGRKSVQSQQLIRSTKNKKSLEDWYGKVCQVCGNKLPAGRKKITIDYAHIQPLGSPHNGPDSTSNMLSLCPNHHRQLDTGAISIEPQTNAILAPRGSSPSVLGRLHLHSQHRLSIRALQYHKDNCFKAGQGTAEA